MKEPVRVPIDKINSNKDMLTKVSLSIVSDNSYGFLSSRMVILFKPHLEFVYFRDFNTISEEVTDKNAGLRTRAYVIHGIK